MRRLATARLREVYTIRGSKPGHLSLNIGARRDICVLVIHEPRPDIDEGATGALYRPPNRLVEAQNISREAVVIHGRCPHPHEGYSPFVQDTEDSLKPLAVKLCPAPRERFVGDLSLLDGLSLTGAEHEHHESDLLILLQEVVNNLGPVLARSRNCTLLLRVLDHQDVVDLLESGFQAVRYGLGELVAKDYDVHRWLNIGDFRFHFRSGRRSRNARARGRYFYPATGLRIRSGWGWPDLGAGSTAGLNVLRRAARPVPGVTRIIWLRRIIVVGVCPAELGEGAHGACYKQERCRYDHTPRTESHERSFRSGSRCSTPRPTGGCPKHHGTFIDPTHGIRNRGAARRTLADRRN